MALDNFLKNRHPMSIQVLQRKGKIIKTIARTVITAILETMILYSP